MASDEAVTRAYYQSLPGKRIGAGLICRDADDRVLLVQPTYKPTWEIPGGVVAEYTSEGTVVPTGKRYANTYIGVWRFRDGRVHHTREYYDPIVSAEALQ